MQQLLHRVPRHAGLWVPLLMLPAVVGEFSLVMTGARPNPGDVLTMGAGVAVFGWYVLGGSLAVAKINQMLTRRKAIRALMPQLADMERPGWLVCEEGVVRAQTTGSAQLGDALGRSVCSLMQGRIANCDAVISRALRTAARRGHAQVKLSDGGRLEVQRASSGMLLLSQIDRETEDQAVELSARYDDLPIAILRLSADGTILSANEPAEALCGAGLAGQPLSAVLTGLGRPYQSWIRDGLQAGQNGVSEVLSAQRGDGDNFVQVTLCRESEDGDTVLAVLSDAEALKTLEAQFVQSQKMQAIGQLAGGIAHDFNNLLTAISGHCDLLMLRHDKGDPDFADLDQISQNANRAASLVSHLLDFSRKQNLKPSRIDLRETLADLSHLLNRLVGDKVRLSVDHDLRLDPVRADRGKIEQVIMNLVVNARDAMPDGGEIQIRTENVALTCPLEQGRFAIPAGRYVKVTLSDTGTGIPEELLNKVFEPFFTTKRVGEGTGLGLSTVYGIVKQTGGYIQCESTVGEGTCFTLYLPAHFGVADEAEEPQESQVSTTGPVQFDKTVLLVEDEAPVRAFASRALKLRGYTVIEAASGEDALALLGDERMQVDLFVSDVMMPGIDGLTWVRSALKDRPGTPVIFMSGYAEDSFEEGRRWIEGASFLQKPFSLSALLKKVDGKLDQREAA